MYESYYHLSANPFRLTPDPRFCFSHSGYQEARAYLQFAFELGEGFILLTGRPGAGKTTLIESFLRALQADNVVTARIAVTDFDAADLLRAVAYYFNIKAAGLDRATLLRSIQQYFDSRVQAGRRVLLVIDEAQRLSHASLEELRMLADMQVGISPLLQIFLVGQESLRDMMRAPDMEQLQQRVVGTCRLQPLDVLETRSYVEHRLRQASWQGDPELTGAAIQAVHEYSKGVPRHINKLCTRLLLQGYMEHKHLLDQEDVHRIAEELGEEQLAPLATASGALGTDHTCATHPAVVPPAQIDLAVRASGARAEPSRPPQEPGPSLGDDQQRRAACVAEALGKRPGRPPAAPAPAESAASTRRPLVAELQTAAPGTEYHRPAGPSRLPVARHSQRTASYPGMTRVPRAESALVSVARGRGKAGVTHLLAMMEVLNKKPAILFSVVAAVTLSAGAVTSLVQSNAGAPLGAQPPNLARALSAPEPSTVVASSADHERRNAGASNGAATVTADPAGAVEPTRQPDSPPASALPPRPVAVARYAPPTGSSTEHAVAYRQGEPAQEARQSGGAAVLRQTIGTVAGQGNVTSHPPQSSTPTGGELASAETAFGKAPQPDESASASPQSHQPEQEPVPVISAALSPPSEPTSHAETSTTATKATAKAIFTPTPEPEVISDEASAARFAQLPTAPEQQVTGLLASAEEALAGDRLLIPAGNCAYYYYQQALKLDPWNAQAREGMDRIVARYSALAAYALGRGDTAKAKRYIGRGLRVRPGDRRLLGMRSNLKVAAVTVAAPNVAAEALPPPPLQNPSAEKNFLQRIKAFFADNGATGTSIPPR